jgi:two-component system alkaline phosphatase synthesis response regulator PhoP
MKQRILLVEDEVALRENLKLNLELEDYKVVAVERGDQALERFRNEKFDLIILDVMLPEINGFDVLKIIRLENNAIPVLFLTAKNTSADIIEGLKIGADDYLTKPFNLEELLLRINKLISRSSVDKPIVLEKEVLHFGSNQVNFKTFESENFKKEKKRLSKKEIMLLKLLSDRENEVVSRNEILEKIWGYDVFPSTRTIDNYILAFRKFFEKDPKNPTFFFSIRGVGYKMIISRK